MSLNETRGGVKMSNGFLKFFFVTKSTGLLFLTVFATSEPVCYTRHTLDNRNAIVIKSNCNGDSDQLCARFASRSDANLLAVLNSPCCNPEENTIYPGGWSQQNDFNAIACTATNLPTVEDGSFDCPADSEVPEGEACSLTCNDGFYPASSSQAVCQVGGANQGGEWSDGIFACQAITCSTTNLPMVANGTFDCPTNSYVSMGKACNVTCSDGYFPAFSHQVVCQIGEVHQGGEWSEGNFTCQAITCSTTNLPIVANGSFDCPTNSDVSTGEACNVTCNDGCLPPFSNQILCQVGEEDQGWEWSAGNFTCLECNGWNEWGESKYKLINTAQSWKESQEFCESYNASLAVVGSEQENAFLHNILTCCCDKWGAWIESFILINGLWKWRGQEEASFINWAEDAPSYDPGNTSMVLIIRKTGAWADNLSSARRPALCERSKYSE